MWLPSGGSLVIDRTEAMTVVDVNTGKFTGQGGNLEETVTRNNLEAAEEIVRQLRLRDIGGIIVVDFIDMVLESNRDLVLRRLLECLGRDRTKHQVAEVTSLGLVQMTRKRIGQGLLEVFSEPCEACQGRGYHVHSEPVAGKATVPRSPRAPAGRTPHAQAQGCRVRRRPPRASRARRRSAAEPEVEPRAIDPEVVRRRWRRSTPRPPRRRPRRPPRLPRGRGRGRGPGSPRADAGPRRAREGASRPRDPRRPGKRTRGPRRRRRARPARAAGPARGHGGRPAGVTSRHGGRAARDGPRGLTRTCARFVPLTLGAHAPDAAPVPRSPLVRGRLPCASS